MSDQLFFPALIFIGVATLLPLLCLGALALLKGRLRHSACRLILLLCALRILIPTASFPSIIQISDIRDAFVQKEQTSDESYEQVGSSGAEENASPIEPNMPPETNGGTVNGGLTVDNSTNDGAAGNIDNNVNVDIADGDDTAQITFDSIFGFLRDNIFFIALSLWGIGAFATVCYMSVCQARVSIRQKRMRFSASAETQELYDNICVELGISSKPKLYVIDAPVEPHISGLFCPAVYLGSTPLEYEEQYDVLCHELTHFKHKDIWVKLFSAFVVTVFWWNPAPRLLCRRLRHEIELACDEAVLSGRGEQERCSYAETILKLLKNTQNRGTVLSVGISSSKSAIVSRFNDIIRATPKRTGRITVTVFCFVMLFSAFILGCNATPYEPESEESSDTTEHPDDLGGNEEPDSPDDPDNNASIDVTDIFFIHGECDLTDAQLSELAGGLEKPQKEGMHMIGWDVFVNSDENGRSIVLSAAFEPNNYNIILQPNGGSVGNVPTAYASLLPDAERQGYTFGGWFFDIELTEQVFAVPSRDVTLYARWLEETPTREFEFSERASGVTIKGHIGESRETIVIPSYIGGKPVSAVGANCFAESPDLVSVTLPYTVNHIGAGAFRRCYSLAEVEIRGELGELDASVFNGCYNLKKIILPKIEGQDPEILQSLPAYATVEYLGD